ncbi:MAG: two-component regulator propeller domain-containing protein [Saprospiraceae bacterium]
MKKQTSIKAWSKLLLLGFLLISSACSSQERNKVSNDLSSPKPIPQVVKNFKAVALAPDFDTTLVSQYIRSIFQDSKGNLWFGTIGEGVVRYDVKSLTYFSNPEGFNAQSVFAINEDKNGNLWFGTDEGVYKYDGSRFRHYVQQDGLSHLGISRKSILVDQSGGIWVGTHGGVFRYNPSEDHEGGQCFSLFQKLPPVNVTGLMEDHAGNIWIATSKKGVFRYDGEAITNFAEKEGLGVNYAGGIAEDKAGNIWFTMKDGICKFDGESFTEYTSGDGLGGTEFWGIYIEQSGIIWVTARGSTTRFDPAAPLLNPNAFTVYTPKDGFTCCVQSMFQDTTGTMWWGTGQGLFRFNGKDFIQVKQDGPW